MEKSDERWEDSGAITAARSQLVLSNSHLPKHHRNCQRDISTRDTGVGNVKHVERRHLDVSYQERILREFDAASASSTR